MLCNYTNHTSQFLLHVCIHSTVPASMLHPCHYLYYLQGQRFNYLHSHSLCQKSMMLTVCSYAMLGNVSVHVDILSCCLPVGDHLVGLLPSRSTIVPPVILTYCCKRIIGCQVCIDQWYQGVDGMAQSCPICRFEGAFTKTTVFRGLEDSLR